MQAAIPHANADLAAENACTMRAMPKAHIRPLTPWRVPAAIAEKISFRLQKVGHGRRNSPIKYG
jgi:hypothetical protein